MHQRTLSKENLVEIFEQSYRFTGVIYFIYLAGGKMILAGWKIILEGGKIILAGLVTTRQPHPFRAREGREFLNNGM